MENQFDWNELFNSVNTDTEKNDEYELESILKDYGDDADADLPENENIEDAVIEKPGDVMISSVFDEIRSKKDMPASDAPEKIAKPETEPEPKPAEKPEEVIKEIKDDDAPKRFFDTETFNSIKDEKNRGPIADFASGKGEEQDNDTAETPVSPEPAEEIDDYEQEEDKEAVVAELRRLVSSASIRCILTFILMCLSCALFAAHITGFRLPGVDIGYDTMLYRPLMLAVSVITVIVNIGSIWDGITRLFKLKCSSESFLALIFAFSTALDICYFVLHTDSADCIMFDPIFVISAFFCIASKRLIAKNIYKNFSIVSSECEKMIIDNRQNDELINDIIVDTGCGSDIVYAGRSGFVSGFIDKSFSDFDLCAKYTGPSIILLILALAAAVVNCIMLSSFTTSLKLMTAALCAVTPLFQGLNFTYALYSNGKRVRKSGGAIIGAESCLELHDVQTVVVDDSDLFSVSLNGIRFYDDLTADKTILYLNSLYSVAGGPLRPLFSNMLNEDMTLPRIDDIYYHDGMGYSSLIDSKVFLAGNRQLMEHFGVEINDKEFEMIYRQKSRSILFAAYDGRLCGVFLLTYSLLPGVKRAFDRCAKDQMFVVIAEHDENINSDTLFDRYETKDGYLFKILNFGNAQRCVQKLVLREKSQSLIASRTGLNGLIYALHGCKSIKFSLSAGRVIRMISSIIALPIIVFLGFVSGLTPELTMQILAYHLLWAIPSLFVSLFSK